MSQPSGEHEVEALVRAHGEDLFRFLYWSLGHREDALDAVQEVLFRAFRGLPKLRDRARVKHWLFRIATNVARDARARRRRTPDTVGIVIDEAARLALAGGGEYAPEARLDAAETERRLARAIAALEPEHREALLLFAVSGLKYREIAEALDWPMGTVTTRIHVAREKLAAFLRDG